MTDLSKDNSYRSILKGISVFGGVQVFQILINLVRGKFVAMFLGPEGMGVSSIFTTSSNTISRASSLGLNLAIVREVAERRDDETGLPVLLGVVRRLIHITALAGCLACALFSGLLSQLSFGTDSYAWQFMLLSVAIYLSVAGSGKLSVLQGLHEVKRVAGSTLVGALAGLCAGVPLYYFFGEKGIVPSIVILSLSTYVFYSYGCRKCSAAAHLSVRLRDNLPLIKKLVGLGMILLAGDLIGAACGYGINIYLRYASTLETVGFYQAANSLTNQYAGMVFTAMSLDYFPRLAANIHNRLEMYKIVNRQMEIVAIVMAPVACVVIITAPLIIRLLLTDSFSEILPLMRWMGLGVMFKALHYPMGYIAFAKNNRRLFFWLEAVIGNVLYVGGLMFFYHFYGFIGLGYAFVADNILTFIIYIIVNRRAYGYRIDRKTAIHGMACVVLATGCFVSSLISDSKVAFALMSFFTAVASIYCLFTIKKKLQNRES
ncbi:MAG: O-antigen translocase [Muribaculaceae bacterium]|nr:O-antigen translocase [Muribaculaceae bacterium]